MGGCESKSKISSILSTEQRGRMPTARALSTGTK